MSNINMQDDRAGAPMPPPVAAPMPAAYAMGPNPADIEQNKVFAVLAYLGILFIVPLLAAKTSPFAMYHANQGLVLFLFGLAVGIITVVPIIGWIVGIAGWIAHIVLMIMGIINAANGQMKPLPVLGGISILK